MAPHFSSEFFSLTVVIESRNTRWFSHPHSPCTVIRCHLLLAALLSLGDTAVTLQPGLPELPGVHTVYRKKKKLKILTKQTIPIFQNHPHVFGSIMHHKRLECHTRSNRKYTYAPLDDVGYIVELQLLVHGPRRF